MNIDLGLLVHDLAQMPALARFADEEGFDGLWTFETAHEPLMHAIDGGHPQLKRPPQPSATGPH